MRKEAKIVQNDAILQIGPGTCCTASRKTIDAIVAQGLIETSKVDEEKWAFVAPPATPSFRACKKKNSLRDPRFSSLCFSTFSLEKVSQRFRPHLLSSTTLLQRVPPLNISQPILAKVQTKDTKDSLQLYRILGRACR